MDCDVPHCCNYAEFYDLTKNLVCRECMEREIEEEGGKPCDYEPI